MSWWTDFLNWFFKPSKPPALPPVPPPSTGRKSFWSVGINAYRSSPLQGCVNDSFNLASYLKPKGFAVHQLMDGVATGQAMEDFWLEAVRNTMPGDLTVLHYSGHGSNGPTGMPADPGQCLVSVDMRPFYASRLGEILTKLVEGGQLVVLLDSCHSETATRLVGHSTYRVPRSIPWSELDISQDPIPSYREAREFNLTALAKSPSFGMIEFAACQANDVTYDASINGQIQGCATRAWIDAGTELDQDWSGGYSVHLFQSRVQTKLPNDEFPNRPQLQASAEQLDQVMWR